MKHEYKRTRRGLIKGGIGLGAIATAWKTPIVNEVVLPAHAQTSLCPMVLPGNITQQPGSGQPSRCSLEFEMLSSEPSSVNIVSITNTTLGANDEISYPLGTSGAATSSSGPRVVWLGESLSAPFNCQDPITEVQFTVTYTCQTNPEPNEATFSLQAIAADAPDL